MSSNGSLYGSAESSNDGGGGGGNGGGEIMLFGVRVKVDPMRKSVSMNNLSQYELPNAKNTVNDHALVVVAEDTGYASADDAVPHQSTGGRERKRGVAWTEEEHKLFLLGLQKVGKGDWRGISRNFVKTRTPTQVASHAQKYFLRKSNLNRRRRRSSLFDITTDSVAAIPMEEGNNPQDTSNKQVRPVPETATAASNISTFPMAPFPVTGGSLMFPVQVQNPVESITFGQVGQVNNMSTMFIRPVPVVPISSPSTMVDLNLNQRFTTEQTHLSLGLSLSSGGQSHFSSFQTTTSSFKNGESYISVA